MTRGTLDPTDHMGTLFLCLCQWRTNPVTDTRSMDAIADELCQHMVEAHDGVQQPTWGIQDPRVAPEASRNRYEYYEQAKTVPD